MKEGMSSFFSAVAELTKSKGFEVADVNEGALTLNLNGEYSAMVDETGAMNYHPYKEVFDMMDEYEVLFTCARVGRSAVPENLFCYDVWRDDDCQGIACEVKSYVAVNH